MATDNLNISQDTEMADCESDKVVTMMDVLQEQQDFEEDANAVLGASDANNCTYSQGYIKRQALYACLTCCPESKTDPNKRAGVCLACSLNCHENHELIELYTKRNFRCDCGNPKFNSNPCQFNTNNDDLNSNNVYNHNFSGLYCICKRPYPDPETNIDEDMIQCIICEDWLHASHLNSVVPPNDQYAEMICKDCMNRNEFLHDYSSFAVNSESFDVDVINTNGEVPVVSICNGDVTTEVETNCQSETNTRISNGIKVDDETETSLEKEEHTTLNNSQVAEANSTETAIKDNINTEMDLDSLEKDGLSTKTSLVAENVDAEANVISTEKETDTQCEDKIPNADDDSCESIEKLNVPDNEIQEQINNTAVVDDIKNSDTGKTETQLLDDNKNVTSKEPVEESAKETETIHERSENLAVMSKDETNSNKDANSIRTDTEIDKMDESEESVTKVESGDIDSKMDPDTNNENQAVTLNENVDKDNADAVMDAIDELLEDPKERLNNDTEDNNVQACEELISNDNVDSTGVVNKTTDREIVESEDKDHKVETVEETVTNNENSRTDTEMTNESIVEQSLTADLIADSNEKSDTDPEMTYRKSIEEQTDTVTKTEKEVPIETSDSNEKCNTDLEITNNKSIDEQKNTSVDSVKKDLFPDDDKSDKTNTNVEVNNSESIDDQIDTALKSENMESFERDQIDTNEDTATADKVEINGDIGNKYEALNKTDSTNNLQDGSQSTNEHKRKLSIDKTEEITKKAKIDDNCARPRGVKKVFKGATFWPSNFRQQLCTCGECISMYKDLEVLFLTDPEDTVSFYEGLGKQKTDAGASQYERGLEALSSLDRIQQINALTEYNNMRDRLLDFLKSFKDRQEVVKEEDIKAFFAGMKPRREPDGVYFCR